MTAKEYAKELLGVLLVFGCIAIVGLIVCAIALMAYLADKYGAWVVIVVLICMFLCMPLIGRND